MGRRAEDGEVKGRELMMGSGGELGRGRGREGS